MVRRRETMSLWRALGLLDAAERALVVWLLACGAAPVVVAVWSVVPGAPGAVLWAADRPWVAGGVTVALAAAGVMVWEPPRGGLLGYVGRVRERVRRARRVRDERAAVGRREGGAANDAV